MIKIFKLMLTYDDFIKLILATCILCLVLIGILITWYNVKQEDHKVNNHLSIKKISKDTKDRIDKMNRRCKR